MFGFEPTHYLIALALFLLFAGYVHTIERIYVEEE